jgi:hypothetical protein
MKMSKLILPVVIAIFLMATATAAENRHENNGPVRGGVYVDENGNYSLNVDYYMPMSSVEEKEFNNKLDNQTILRATVLIRSRSEGKEYSWTVDFEGSGFAKDGRVFLYSDVDQAGPDNDTYEVKEYKGAEVIETTPYLKW